MPKFVWVSAHTHNDETEADCHYESEPTPQQALADHTLGEDYGMTIDECIVTTYPIGFMLEHKNGLVILKVYRRLLLNPDRAKRSKP